MKAGPRSRRALFALHLPPKVRLITRPAMATRPRRTRSGSSEGPWSRTDPPDGAMTDWANSPFRTKVPKVPFPFGARRVDTRDCKAPGGAGPEEPQGSRFRATLGG